MARAENENFEDILFRGKDAVVTLATVTNRIKTSQVKIVADSLIIFHRIIISKQSDDYLKEFLKYEFSPFLLSLFSENDMCMAYM